MLGINIDIKKLKLTSYVAEMISKCKYQLNALQQKSNILNKNKTNMFIYHAFIEAHLNYYTLICMKLNRTDTNNIENVQKQALRQFIPRNNRKL